MRIISKTHDYYDGVARTGVDTETRYLRNATEADVVVHDARRTRGKLPESARRVMEIIEIAGDSPSAIHRSRLRRRWWVSRTDSIELGRGHVRVTPRIALAGDAVGVTLGLAVWKINVLCPTMEQTTWCATSGHVRAFARGLAKRDRSEIEGWLDSPGGSWAHASGRTRAEVLDDGAQARTPLRAALRALSARPVVVVRRARGERGRRIDGETTVRLVEDATLAEHGGPKLWTAEQTHQAIFTYLASQARGEPPMAGIPDTNLARQKGFDRWSFRREPGRRKHRARRDPAQPQPSRFEDHQRTHLAGEKSSTSIDSIAERSSDDRTAQAERENRAKEENQ